MKKSKITDEDAILGCVSWIIYLFIAVTLYPHFRCYTVGRTVGDSLGVFIGVCLFWPFFLFVEFMRWFMNLPAPF